MYDITSTRADHWIVWEKRKGGMCVRAKLEQPKPTEHRLVKLGQAAQPSPRRLNLQKIQHLTNREKTKNTCRNTCSFFFLSDDLLSGNGKSEQT